MARNRNRDRRPRAGDAARSMALLWSSQLDEGRSGLSLGNIVDAAVRIADRDGIEALSMRHVADALEVGVMSLYTYVPGKAELTELMIDRVHAAMYGTADEPRQAGTWRNGLDLIAHRNWDVLVAHSWLMNASTPRPVVGPHITLKYEAELRPLEGLGLDDVEMDSILSLVLAHAAGSARAQVQLVNARRDARTSDHEWWREVAPVLERVVDPHRFPIATRVGAAASAAYQGVADPLHAFRFGLRCILDGVALLIDERRTRR